MASNQEVVRSYLAGSAAVFCRTQGPFGALSNMARGFPISIGGLEIPSAEALYQALRFPHRADIQQLVLQAKNAWLAKQVARTHAVESRGDWNSIRVRVMRWCLRLKTGHAPQRFGAVLLSTGDRPIVELSDKDTFWGAARAGQRLVGVNALGRLLMEVREELRLRGPCAFQTVAAPSVSGLVLLGANVRDVVCVPIESAVPQQELLQLPISPNQGAQSRPLHRTTHRR
jgi:type I restriction enzyme S subunit